MHLIKITLLKKNNKILKNKSYLRAGIKLITNTISQETGLLIDTNVKVHTYIAESKEDWFITYSSLLGVFNELSLGAIKSYAYILKNYNFDTQFEIGKATRRNIADYCKISESNVAASLAELKDKELLFSPNRSIYMINPRYAFKGSTSNRNYSLKAIIELGCKNC